MRFSNISHPNNYGSLHVHNTSLGKFCSQNRPTALRKILTKPVLNDFIAD